jgi:triacylglycerol lipase
MGIKLPATYNPRPVLNARRLVSVFSVFGLLSCGTDTIVTKGGPPQVNVSITTDVRSMFAGQHVQFVATAKDATGKAISGATYSWSSSNSAAVAITSDGMASAVAFGSSTISVTSEGVTTTVEVKVLHDPIIFVNGFQGSTAIWTTMIDRLKVDGWTDAPLVAWTYDSNQSNVTTAQRLQTTVDSLLAATGAKKVDIIAHSMGGLLARYFSKNLAGSEKIDGFVFLGTPNHGTTLADLCPIQSCIEMRPGSAFLAALNAGDETPGTARYATWWTPCDQLTTPPESVVLAGATNTQAACMSHSDLYINSTVYAQVRDWIR